MGSGRGDRNQEHDPDVWVLVTPASMGSGRGDRNQAAGHEQQSVDLVDASMGSGRGDRNQQQAREEGATWEQLQWGPVVVTGISRPRSSPRRAWPPRFNGVRSW